MRKQIKVLSVFLCVVLLFLCIFIPHISAEITLGDIDGDGDITNQDLILLFQYLSGWEVFDRVDVYATDIDGDDNTTNQDVIMLFQYLSGWDVIIGKNGLDEENEESNTGHSTETFINPNTGFMWPVTGCYTITTPFVPPSTGNHLGIDIGGNGIAGRPILAIADGVVITAQDSWTSEMGIIVNRSYGNYCVVNHGYVEINGKSAQYVSFYAHATDIIVSEGETVKQGQVIGYVGTTGDSTEPHLHIGILKNGSWVNPYPLLRE